MIGTEGALDIGWNDFKLITLKRSIAPGYSGYDSFESFSSGQKEDFKKWYAAKFGDKTGGFEIGKTIQFTGYPNMFTDMFDAIETNGQPLESFYDGYIVNAILDAALLSAKSKQGEPYNSTSGGV